MLTRFFFLLILSTGVLHAQSDSSYMSLDAALKNPTAVKKLYLYHQCVIPAAIGSLVNLEELGIRQGYVSDLPAEFSQLKKLKVLDLWDNYFKTVPICITQLPALEELDMSHNLVLTLPAEIGNMKTLRKLALYSNRISVLPKEIGLLSSLLTFDLRFNRLNNLPKEITLLKQLHDLILSGNEFSALPEEVSGLDSLRYINLSRNKLNSIPESLGRLTVLNYLDLTMNKITVLPESVWKLPSLEALLLDGNEIKTVPTDLSSAKIERLWYDANHLKEVPAGIFTMHSLQWLFLDRNEIDTIPPAITNLKNLYYISIQKNNSQLRLPNEFFTMKIRYLHMDQAVYLHYQKEIDEIMWPGLDEFMTEERFWQRKPQDAIFAHERDYKKPSRSKRYEADSRFYFETLKGAIYNSDSVRVLDLSYHWNDSSNCNHGYIDSLFQIEELYFCNRHYERLPFSGINFSHLRVLDLSGTPVREFPESFNRLTSLHELNLSNMRLGAIPAFVYALDSLEVLDISTNNFLVPTKEIKKLRGLKTLIIDEPGEDLRKKLRKWLPGTEIEFVRRR